MRRLFENKIVVIGIVVLFLFLLAAFTAGENSRLNVVRNVLSVPLTPLQNGVQAVSGKIKDTVHFFQDIRTARAENEELRNRVSELERELDKVHRLQSENQNLKNLLSFKEEYDHELIASNIISKGAGNWFEIFTIDKGSKDGITVDAPVINASGLVGRISRVDLFSSRVISIIDTESSVSARLSKTRDLVVLRGDIQLKAQGLCRLDYITPDIEVSVGDKVETSGLSSLYPKGIIIGEIVQIVRNEGQYDYYAIVKPTVDFRRLEEVAVIKRTAGEDMP